MLSEFMLRYPKVQIHLEPTNRRVDVLAEGLDLALRVRPLPLADSELVLRILSDRGQCLVAAPALLAQFGTPQLPAELSQLPAMSRARPEEQHSWQLCHSSGEHASVSFTPRYITTDMLALKTAALAGVGIVQLPQLMLTDELAQGKLIRLLPEWEPKREVIHLVYPSRRGQLPSVRALIDFFAEKYQRHFVDGKIDASGRQFLGGFPTFGQKALDLHRRCLAAQTLEQRRQDHRLDQVGHADAEGLVGL